MHVLLERLFKKRGIKGSEELSEEKTLGQPSEKETYEEWNRILSQDDEVTIEDIKKFCQTQINDISKQIRDPENTLRLNHLATMLDVFSSLSEALESNKNQREMLERHILDLIQKQYNNWINLT